MSFQVISIEKNKKINAFDVVISGGLEHDVFHVDVEVFKIADREVQNISGEDALWKYFEYHPMMVNEVHQLVAKVYNGKKVEFPFEITNFLPMQVTA